VRGAGASAAAASPRVASSNPTNNTLRRRPVGQAMRDGVDVS
jgi:hypothetical protein